MHIPANNLNLDLCEISGFSGDNFLLIVRADTQRQI